MASEHRKTVDQDIRERAVEHTLAANPLVGARGRDIAEEAIDVMRELTGSEDVNIWGSCSGGITTSAFFATFTASTIRFAFSAVSPSTTLSAPHSGVDSVILQPSAYKISAPEPSLSLIPCKTLTPRPGLLLYPPKCSSPAFGPITATRLYFDFSSGSNPPSFFNSTIASCAALSESS